MISWLHKTIIGQKIRVVPASRGKKGIDWKRYYKVQFNDVLGWWTVKEFDSMDDAQVWVELEGPFNKHHSVEYKYLK